MGDGGVVVDALDDPGGWDAKASDPSDEDDAGSAGVSGRGGGFDALTPKQRQVLDLLIQHKTSKEISRLLGISPHTVDQRIMLARAKLGVATRGEVAQAYRRLLDNARNPGVSDMCEQSIYGFSHVARPAPAVHAPVRDDVVSTARPLPFMQGDAALAGTAAGHPSRGAAEGDGFGQPYYHVLPEMFDGPNGTLLRLGAIALIAVFLVLVVMGGLAMFAQLSQMVDR